MFSLVLSLTLLVASNKVAGWHSLVAMTCILIAISAFVGSRFLLLAVVFCYAASFFNSQRAHEGINVTCKDFCSAACCCCLLPYKTARE